MLHDDWDPKQLEAATRVFISDQQRFLRNRLLRVAEISLTRWDRALEKAETDAEVATEALPELDAWLDNPTLMRREEKTGASDQEQILIRAIRLDKGLQVRTETEQQGLDDAMREFSVMRQKCEETIALWERLPQEIERKKLDRLETLLRLLNHSSRRSVERFRPFGKLLAEDGVRRRVTREVVEALLPIVRELCEWFEAPARAGIWKATGFEPWLLSELQRFAADAILQAEPEAADPNAGEKGTDASSSAPLVTDGATASAEPALGNPQPTPDLAKTELASPAPPSVISKTPDSAPGAKHMTAATPLLSKRLQRGKECEEMVTEIMKIKNDVREGGMTIYQSREAHPDFRIWQIVEALALTDKAVKETFMNPHEWGPVRGYANQLLAKHYGVLPSTIDESRADWRSHRKKKSAIPQERAS